MTPFEHHGRNGEMIRLALVNLLWSIATLSIWRFWGRTRVRRLLWGNTTLLGDPLEYTGTGKELFLGFLVVLATLYLPIILAFAWAQVLLEGDDPLGAQIVAVLYPLIFFLVSAGLYRARRYQLSRTRWRGIRGGQGGQAWRFGLMSLAVALATAATLGWALPWGEMWLARYKLRHTRFGDRAFDCDASAKATWGAFAGFWLGGLVGLFSLGALGVLGASAAGASNQVVVIVAVPLFYLALLVVLTLAYAGYRAAFYRALAEGTRFMDVRFSAEVERWPLVRLYLGNLLISLVSLGVLRPWAALRTFGFTCRTVRVSGVPDVAAIHQGLDSGPRTGEGLVSVFDGAGDF